ncbi:hypothetical protein ANAPC1_00300 [Anaplasma phagocytophilum]|uniref:Uncharacterized protein n=1 Tax=Anaplasma phagocytophilum TaxID=948 RepID=A0AA45ZH55_ANAPH|nr:hypothetical protein ANAPC1_00300 [Anaplasma phagocytophilum]
MVLFILFPVPISMISSFVPLSCLSVVIQNFSVSVASNVFVNLNPKASMFLCYARAVPILVLKIFLS